MCIEIDNQNKMMIRENILNLIRKNKTCKTELQLALDKSAVTIQRYLDDNDIMLTTAAALEVIKRHLDKTEDEILEENGIHA